MHFEKEHINSISEDGELMLSLLASFAQAESESMSANIKWAKKKQAEQGIMTNTSAPFGYRVMDKIGYWRCKPCGGFFMRDDDLKNLTATVMGTDTFDENAFVRLIDCIDADADKRLIFQFKDGHSSVKDWKPPEHRGMKWSEERKQEAKASGRYKWSEERRRKAIENGTYKWTEEQRQKEIEAHRKSGGKHGKESNDNSGND